jgi:hypothetical protein
MPQLHLFLAFFWLIFGVGWILLARGRLPGAQWTILGTNLSVGWVGLILAFYNLVRWWTIRRTLGPKAKESGQSAENRDGGESPKT